VAYLSVETRPIITTRLKHNGQAMKKKEVSANDDTGIIKLTLWGSLIDMAPVNGVYSVNSVKVREWPTKVFAITTTPSSHISRSEKVIMPTNSVLKELVSTKLSFPPESVSSIATEKACNSCNAKSVSNSILFKCIKCGSMVLSKNLKTKVTVKMVFSKHNVIMYENFCCVVLLYCVCFQILPL